MRLLRSARLDLRGKSHRGSLNLDLGSCMKKAVFAVVLALFASISFGTGFAAENAVKITVSETPPADILALAKQPLTEIAKFGISTGDNGVFDYGIHVFVKKDSVTPDVPDVFMVVSFEPLFDENRNAVPCEYSATIVGLVFIEERAAWFVSEEAKSAFIKALE